MTPTQLKAKEFEEALMQAAERCPGVHMVRYGTQATFDGNGKPMAIQSLPDFEGVYNEGRQFIIEAKVCSQSAFPMEKKTIKPRQVKHMLDRARCGVPCFLIIHFNERRLVKIHEPAETRAIRIHPLDDRWERYVDAYAEARRTKQPVAPQGSISREMACRMSVKVEWIAPKGRRKELPDLGALLGIPSAEQPSLSLFE
jgi:hypothetical protein